MPVRTEAKMHLNGRIVDYADCTVHAFSSAVKYGCGVFEGLRGYWNEDRREHYVFRLREHVERFFHSIELVTMVVFGGMASTFGAVVGAAVLTTLPQALTVFKEYEMVVFGAVMMLTMIFMPRGLVPTLAALLARRPK